MFLAGSLLTVGGAFLPEDCSAFGDEEEPDVAVPCGEEDLRLAAIKQQP